MKIPTRPAPAIPRGESTRGNYQSTNSTKRIVTQTIPKKKPPPRPPPPKFTNSLIQWDDDCSTSTSKPFSVQHNLPNRSEFTSLLDLSISQSDTIFTNSKPVTNANITVDNSTFFGNNDSLNYLDLSNGAKAGSSCKQNMPTIIRAQPKIKKDHNNIIYQFSDVGQSDRDYNNYSPPMPTIPPPSPPKNLLQSQTDIHQPHGIALYNYTATHKDDLSFQINDIIILLRKVNDEWLYGKNGDKQGIFPANFLEIRIPLPKASDNIVTALYAFHPETLEDLKLVPGQKIRIIRRISTDWLYGESNGQFGQFPANFIDYIPLNL